MCKTEQLTFRVRGAGTWEDRDMMMRALLMIKGVTEVDEPGATHREEWPSSEVKTCAEAAERWKDRYAKDTKSDWHRADRVDGDPYWTSHLHGLDLLVSVPIGCPWAWEWSVTANDALPEGGIELARGDMYVDHEDDEEDDWNYQGVERVQQRCEAVARGLFDDGEGACSCAPPCRCPSCDSGSISIEANIWRCQCCNYSRALQP